uniref:Caspase recruitment domain family, member 14 n=1 Tax=Cynoglossus semilaevis TaxID=244447 RepID=A0A3P8WCM7_CYNSE
MAGECVLCEGPDLKEMSEEELWNLINDNRHRISLGVRPGILIPYLRQARVLTEMDEDEILSSHNLTNRSMRTSYMLDLLMTQGRNGAVALLEGLMIHYPTLYTQVTGRQPSTEPSRFSGLIKYSELTEYLVRAVTGMQKELQEARREAGRMTARCTALESDISQMIEQEEKSRCLQTEMERMRRHLCSLQREVTKLKDEKCELYMRYTAAIEEKSAVNKRLHDLNLQVGVAYQSRDEAQTMIARLLAEKDSLRCQLVEVQGRVFSQQAKCKSRRMYIYIYVFKIYSHSLKHQHHFPSSSFSSCESVPPFLLRCRPKAMRISDRVLSISFQGEALLTQLTVVGGNKTGVFVRQVTEGSMAQTVALVKALRMVLLDSTLEEAMWALGQVTGLCTLSLRPRQDDYEALLQQLQNKEISSGDSFYVRVNLSLPAGDTGDLALSCHDILHVTNTKPDGTEDSWFASQVHPCRLLDLQSGTLPNYYRAQVLLIQAIEDMSFQTKKSLKVRRIKCTQKVSLPKVSLLTQHSDWFLSNSLGDTSAPKSCVTLMPYTLVTPHYPPVCRPVLLLPTILGRMLDKKLEEWPGFQVCEPEILSSCEHAARLQRSDILDGCDQEANSCYTLQGVEKIMKKAVDVDGHQIFLYRSDFIQKDVNTQMLNVKSSVPSRSKLQRLGQSDEQLLACSKSEEPLLDKLPCLYRSVAADSWCDQTSLLTSLRTVIWEEQKKIVWVEPDLW